MPQPFSIFPGTENESLNFKLWLGVLLPPVAGGLNTVVGYMVSNYSCNVHNRHLVMLVNAIAFGLCVIAAITTTSVRTRVEQPTDDLSPSLLHTRRLLLYLGYWFAAGFALFILAGTISTFILRPCDL
ncbi:hypothetical protein JAO29_17265 [Edaphobacter sp. HDX4]|uniref:hypothetical protein n=1 Tax=Edaphobacter sp. HDX4 TaxID=2794064 RepID=UPI002FE693BF